MTTSFSLSKLNPFHFPFPYGEGEGGARGEAQLKNDKW